MAEQISSTGLDTKKTFEQLMGVQRPYLAGVSKAREDVTGAEADIAQAQQRQAEVKAEALRAPVEKYATDVQTAQQAYEQKKAAEPIPSFVPTKDSAEDLGKLFSFIGVMGTFVGRGAGKQAAMGAMSAMTGMMKGWQEGRQDLYRQEQIKFEKDFARVQKVHQDLAKELETAVKTAATNKELGVRLAEEAAIKAGSDIVAAQIRKNGLTAALETAKEMSAAAGKVGGQVEKLLEADIRARGQVEAAAARAAGGGTAAAGWKLYQTKDGKIVRYNSRTNEIEGGNLNELVGATPVGAKQASAGAGNDRYAFNIIESFSQAATDLLNVSQMPANTVLGVFAGMTGQSGDTLIKSLQNTLARQVTKEDSRLMQQIVAGLDQNMARALGGGYATSTSKGLIQAYKEQVAQFGDSPLAQAMFLSRMKQELEILAKAFKNHPGAKEGYVSNMKDYVSELNKAIPFSVSDVIAANRGQKQTVTDKFSYLAQKPVVMKLPEEGEPVAQPRPQTPAVAKPSAPAAAAPAERPKNMRPDARQAEDGNWYYPDPSRPGKYIRVDPSSYQ